jgi:hypothetical protein
MVFSRKMMVLVVAATAMAASSAMAADPVPAPAAPGCPAPDNKDAVAYIKNPKWLRRPSGDDVASVYPPHAQREHKSDRTVMDCAIADDGTLQSCEVLDDKAPGRGFDKAALSLTKLFKMPPLAEQTAFTGLPECIRKLGPPHVVIPMDWSATGTSWSGR